MSESLPSVLIRREDEAWSDFAKRVQVAKGEIVVVLSAMDQAELEDATNCAAFFAACAQVKQRVRVAVKNHQLLKHCRKEGIRVIERSSALKQIAADSPQLEDALRTFSPHLWQQQLRSRLQSMGLLSLPKLRIWILIGTSVLVFFFVIFRLLPSAEVRVWPRQDTVSQTVNIYMALSGETVSLPKQARKSPLHTFKVDIKQTLSFDQIHEEFTGNRSTLDMTVYNNSKEKYSLRTGTRLVNSGGIVFRLQEPAIMDAGKSVTVHAQADDTDLYGAIIGARGNVKANQRWDFPGLSEAERKIVYGKNIKAGQGGSNGSRRVLSEKDLQLAQKQLEQKLLATANQMIADQIQAENDRHPERKLVQFPDAKLIRIFYHDTVLPQQFLGQAVTSVPVEESLAYRVFAYDAKELLSMLRDDLGTHIEDGKRLLPGSVTDDRLKLYVVKVADDFTWVKATVDLSGTEEFVLDPITPVGAQFGKKVRESIIGAHRDDAAKIIRNMPEVDKVEIHLWPPWNRVITGIPANISIAPQ